MQSNTIIIGIIILIGIIGGYFLLMTGDETSNDTDVMEGEAMMEADAMMVSEESMMKDEDAMEGEAMMEADAMMVSEESASAGTYSTYSPDKLALAESGDVVLFFKASWCPSCRALDADIKNNLSSIPGDLTILEVDYDAATDLKRKYGVTTQHTLVQVDANGDLVTKWSGGNVLSSVVEKTI